MRIKHDCNPWGHLVCLLLPTQKKNNWPTESIDKRIKKNLFLTKKSCCRCCIIAVIYISTKSAIQQRSLRIPIIAYHSFIFDNRAGGQIANKKCYYVKIIHNSQFTYWKSYCPYDLSCPSVCRLVSVCLSSFPGAISCTSNFHAPIGALVTPDLSILAYK